ncbi:Acetyl-CoA acetyltransferase [Paraburkholderia domus]|uniref:acetyl-CoA C-acyltransferase n=1 Tax=Paraburkholderia domus TaxID=2793075 RepID=UPI00191434A7|nr:acetyl-CoA C-acyltransferase [Paraburkholderia domus]MBK5050534.1 acetyl-CoA C-acyltransferase [Burkholderia sp. R-70006]CAE6752928.1 Acetyl-CoA acetyltransferase [Paraburkholderia domus]
MNNDPVVIVSVARTPMGGFQGDLSGFSASQLGGVAIQAAVERSGIEAAHVQEVVMGCVLPAGLGQAPARQASINAGLPLSVACSTVGKVCGSGMKAAIAAHDALVAGSSEVIVAGGMESMTNAPYLLPKARGGFRLGHSQVIDHMFFDGLEDAYFDKGRLMGTFAEECATTYGFTREDQDAYATSSTTRAQDAIKTGVFAWEIAPVTAVGKSGDRVIEHDEQPPKARLDKIASLKPSFRKDGTVTAANSSSISDGAAALVMMRRSTADRLGAKPIAMVVGHATHAQEPSLFTTAPVGAIQKLLSKTDWAVNDVDAWEINEAFAVVAMAAIRDLELDRSKVNTHGGACALGHPIGASGARLLVTLVGTLRNSGGKRGIASLCIGGGEATAMAIEML